MIDLPDGTPEEILADFEYPLPEFRKDMNGVMYYMQRSGPAKKPKVGIEDGGEVTTYEINTDNPMVRRYEWFLQQYDDQDECEARVFTFDMVLRAFREHRDRLVAVGLMERDEAGFSMHEGLTARFLKAKRLSDGENSWLDEREVSQAIEETVAETRS